MLRGRGGIWGNGGSGAVKQLRSQGTSLRSVGGAMVMRENGEWRRTTGAEGSRGCELRLMCRGGREGGRSLWGTRGEDR